MAGKRHHHIPQCLLRGFSREDAHLGERVMVFRRGEAPVSCSPRDVAVSERFYSQAVDAQISAVENILAPVLAELRAAPPDNPVDASFAEKAVVHLGMRNAHVRQEIDHVFAGLLTAIENQNTDPKFMQRLVQSAGDPGFGEGLVAFIEGHLRDLPEEEQTEQTRQLADRRALLAALRQTAQDKPEELFESLQNIIGILTAWRNTLSRNVHVKLVQETFVLGGRVPALAEFSWFVEGTSADGFVLPDCAVAWIAAAGGTAQPYVFSSIPDAPIVTLPISSTRMLVGHRDGAWSPMVVDDINRLLVTCSRSFFVGSPGFPSHAQLVPFIGTAGNGIKDALASALATLP